MLKTFRLAAAVTALVLGLGGGAMAEGQGTAITHEIAPGVFSFDSGGGYHSMFVVTDDGVAAFETINSKHSTAMLAAIASVTDQPVKYALHTHNHWDHASGGKVFQDAGAQTVMHKKANEWVIANPGRDMSTMDIVWDGARRDIPLGDITIQAHYLGLNHGLGMAVFVIPELRVAYIGDLVTPNRVMFSIVPDFNIGEWERSLAEIEALDFDIAVCSHSELPADELKNGCTKAHVTEERMFISDLRNAIFAEFQKGTPANEVPAAVELPQYAHWKHYDDWLELNAQRLLLDIWMGPYPWAPAD